MPFQTTTTLPDIIRYMMVPFVLLAVLVPMRSVILAGERTVQTLRDSDIDSALKSLWKDMEPTGSGRDWMMQQTTWLPSEWPPSPKTVWSKYVYGLDVTLDGVAGVSAPMARIERQAGVEPARVLIPMGRRLKAVASHPVRPKGGWRYTAEDEKRILDEVLGLKNAPPRKPKGTHGVRAYFQSWKLGSSEIAALVASRHGAFFAWLEE